MKKLPRGRQYIHTFLPGDKELDVHISARALPTHPVRKNRAPMPKILLVGGSRYVAHDANAVFGSEPDWYDGCAGARPGRRYED